MALVQRNKETQRAEYIGRAWVNINQETGDEFIKIQLDQDVESVQLTQGYSLYLNANQKREGKKDADFRVTLRKNKPRPADTETA